MTENSILETILDYGIAGITVSAVLRAALTLLVCVIIVKILMKIFTGILERGRLEKGLKGFLRSAVKAGLWFLAIIITADSAGIPVTSLVTVLGVAGLALSLSLQNTLTNVFAGITILGMRPFVAGEYIDIDGIGGTVREVGLFNTTMSTPDNRLIHIPNSSITTSRITNYSREPNRRLDMKFSVACESDIEEVRAAILDAVSSDDRPLSEPAPFCGIEGYGDGKADYILRVWVKNSDYWDLSFSLNEKILPSLMSRGVSLSRRMLDVRIKDD